MRFGVIANLKRAGAKEAVDSFIKWAGRTLHPLVLCEDLRGIAGDGLAFSPRRELAPRVDVVVSMGGDGTLLATARDVGLAQTPILGINLGSLGFLTQFTFTELIPVLDRIAAGDYRIQQRMVLKVEMQSSRHLSSPYALNDVVVDNGGVSRIVEINLRVNGEDIVTYKADGLVISTPTGSTAYSLAVGGPIMGPEMEAIIAAPIASFSLSTRPMVFCANDVIELQVQAEDWKAGLTLDGQVMEEIENTDVIRITKAKHTCRFIVFPGNSFYQVLKSKLHWGVSPTAKR